MPWASDVNAGYTQPQAVGPILLATPGIPTPPATIASGANWTSGVLSGDGFKVIAIGATSTQTGAISVQRYLDMAGTIAQGAVSTQALAAGTPAVLNVTDGLPYATFTVTITNTGGGSATISNFVALLAAA